MKTLPFQLPIFVGHVFKQDQLDDLRQSLESALSETPFLALVYADTARFHGALFPKIARLIDSAAFCVFDVTEPNTNVFLELGYALGRGKLCVPIIRMGATVPSDIAGFERITYSSYKDLSSTLRTKMQDFTKVALARLGHMENLGHTEFFWFLRNHRNGQEINVAAMKETLRPYDVSSLEVDEMVTAWRKKDFLKETNGKIFITALGEDFLVNIIRQHPELSKRQK
jgi:hypothetical protein